MQKSIKEFLSLFERIRSAGFIRTHRTGNTGIGKTFEDACGIVENNIEAPDFKGIEIKSRRSYAQSYITLFTKSPSFPRGVNTFLRQEYGSGDVQYPDIKVLHTSIFGNKFNSHVAGYGYKIETNDAMQRIDLRIKNLITEQEESSIIYWTYSDIERILTNKLSTVALVEAETRKIDGYEEFYFTRCTILTGFNLKRFLKLVNEGKIMLDIRIGAYKTGAKAGKTHDHGSGFRISRNDLQEAFDVIWGEL